ncbi:GNAT family N-acetyltransferase [Actinoplanes regularis]|nr:GNAT family N-acetyltransferase [Actinoplanes regularis]
MGSEEVEIRPAMSDDLQEILELARSRALDVTPRESAMTDGFLVSDFDIGDYRRLLERAEYFYVVRVQKRLAGFVIAYGKDRVQGDEWLNVRLGDFFDDFIVIKQVCVSLGHAGQGIASLLYNRVIDRNPDINIAAAVVTDPENRPSTGLHRKLGFRPAISMTPPDGLPRTVWVRLPRSTRMLEQQLHLAVDLYKHEDLLNWQKLNNFFYVTVGLAALCGISLGLKNNDLQPLILLLTSLLGMVSAVAFSVTLGAGVFYLQWRKEAIAHLERVAEMKGGTVVLFGRKGIGRRRLAILAKSPSNYVLRGIPAFIGAGWLILAIVQTVAMAF